MECDIYAHIFIFSQEEESLVRYPCYNTQRENMGAQISLDSEVWQNNILPLVQPEAGHKIH